VVTEGGGGGGGGRKAKAVVTSSTQLTASRLQQQQTATVKGGILEGQKGGVLQHASPPDTTFQQQCKAAGWTFSGLGRSSAPRHQQTAPHAVGILQIHKEPCCGLWIAQLL
jgi:hypothetical protein